MFKVPYLVVRAMSGHRRQGAGGILRDAFIEVAGQHPPEVIIITLLGKL